MDLEDAKERCMQRIEMTTFRAVQKEVERKVK